MQYEGGPCAVIAPVQGFIVKNAVFGDNVKEDLSTVTGGWVFNLLTPGKFYKSFFFKILSGRWNKIRVPNSLALGPNCLQSLSVDDPIRQRNR